MILDVGANSGEWSKEFLLLKPKSTIHIFEPSKSHYESLIEFAGTKNNQIIVHQIGLSGDGRECLLYSPNPGSGAASIYNKENLGNRYRETIQTNTLSNVLSELPLSVGCKLDFEGAELEVLTSARDVLKNSNIRVLGFEFGENTTLLRQSFRDFLISLSPLILNCLGVRQQVSTQSLCIQDLMKFMSIPFTLPGGGMIRFLHL